MTFNTLGMESEKKVLLPEVKVAVVIYITTKNVRRIIISDKKKRPKYLQ